MLASLRCCKTFSSTELNSSLILIYNFSLLKSGTRFDTGSTWIGIYIHYNSLHLLAFTEFIERKGNKRGMASLVAQMVKNLPAMQETQFHPRVGKIPWRRERLPTPVFLPGESAGQRSLAGCSLWGHRDSDRTEQLTLFWYTE